MESGRLGWKDQGRKKERRTHVTASDREVRRKEKENRCNDDVGYADYIGDPAKNPW
jgi:hypothetical protein